MPTFAADLSLMFTHDPFLDRFERAREAGFSWVEYPFPYLYPPAELKRRLDRHGLRQALFNIHCGDWNRGDRGIAADPGMVDEFRTMLPRAVEYALMVQAGRLNCLAGRRVPRRQEADQWETLVGNVTWAARALGRFGLGLLVEPVSSREVADSFLDSVEKALYLLARVDEANVALNLDLSAVPWEEDLLSFLRRHPGRIGHVRATFARGGGTGAVFRTLDQLGFEGQVGVDQWPVQDGPASHSRLRHEAGLEAESLAMG